MLQIFHNSFADIAFTLYLLVYFPLDAIRRSLFIKTSRPELSALRSYWRQGRYVMALFAALILVSWTGNHSASQLGLAIPPPPAGIWGLGIALVLLTTMHFLGIRQESRMSSDQRNELEKKLQNLPFPIPQTRLESAAYLITMLGMTTTWEVLFRGYLLLVLTPVTGLPMAIALAAIAYGAGHGYESLKQFAGSITVSLLFTMGYALSGSLWWLIVLHAAVPVSMLFAVRKLNQASPNNAVPV